MDSRTHGITHPIISIDLCTLVLLPLAYISSILTLIMDTHASTLGHEYSPLCENKQKQVKGCFGFFLVGMSLGFL